MTLRWEAGITTGQKAISERYGRQRCALYWMIRKDVDCQWIITADKPLLQPGQLVKRWSEYDAKAEAQRLEDEHIKAWKSGSIAPDPEEAVYEPPARAQRIGRAPDHEPSVVVPAIMPPSADPIEFPDKPKSESSPPTLLAANARMAELAEMTKPTKELPTADGVISDLPMTPNEVKAMRLAKGLSLDALSRLAGVSYPTASNFESGLRRLSREYAMKIINAIQKADAKPIGMMLRKTHGIPVSTPPVAPPAVAEPARSSAPKALGAPRKLERGEVFYNIGTNWDSDGEPGDDFWVEEFWILGVTKDGDIHAIQRNYPHLEVVEAYPRGDEKAQTVDGGIRTEVITHKRVSDTVAAAWAREADSCQHHADWFARAAQHCQKMAAQESAGK